MPASTEKVMGKSNAAAFVLEHWDNDHKNMKACINLLEAQFSRGRLADISDDFVLSLIEQFIDAPDDFHHILERKAYRRAWFRSGRYLPAILDLDEQHTAIRKAREHFVGDLVKLSSCAREKLRQSIAQYAACARNALNSDEKLLYPILQHNLTRDDWCELAEEISSYKSVINMIRPNDVTATFLGTHTQ